jgi:Mg-chelatase subunit ChlD
MGLFGKREKRGRGTHADHVLPSKDLVTPSLAILRGFREDENLNEPVVRLTRFFRERFGVGRGDTVVLKKGDRMIRARVEVSSAEDGSRDVARLNPRSRELLDASIGDRIDILPREVLFLLIDTSGSMADFVSGVVKMEASKNAVREFIRSKFLMGQGDRLGIIGFGERAVMIEPPSIEYEHVENRTGILSPSGSTALFEGMKMAIDNLTSEGGAKRIVLLTDGVPTTTGRGPVIDLAKQAASRHIVIDTVGVGSPFDFMSYDEPLLRRIAAITGGTFRRVLDIQQLTGQFRELALGKNYTHLLPEN